MPNNIIYLADGHKVGHECAESTGADGQTVVAVTEKCIDYTTPLTSRHDVYVTWTNARVTLAVTGDLKRGATTAFTTPLLTAQQLIAIATDPELTVTA